MESQRMESRRMVTEGENQTMRNQHQLTCCNFNDLSESGNCSFKSKCLIGSGNSKKGICCLVFVQIKKKIEVKRWRISKRDSIEVMLKIYGETQQNIAVAQRKAVKYSRAVAQKRAALKIIEQSVQQVWRRES